jgi:hypothetical protein
MIRTGLLLVITALIGVAFAQGWVRDYLSPSPEEVANQRQRVSALPRRLGHSIARQFSSMSVADQTAIRAHLKQQVQSVDNWIRSVGQAKPQLICLGGRSRTVHSQLFGGESIFTASVCIGN